MNEAEFFDLSNMERVPDSQQVEEAAVSPVDVTDQIPGYNLVKERLQNRRIALAGACRFFNADWKDNLIAMEEYFRQIHGDEVSEKQYIEVRDTVLDTYAKDITDVAQRLENWLNRDLEI